MNDFDGPIACEYCEHKTKLVEEDPCASCFDGSKFEPAEGYVE